MHILLLDDELRILQAIRTRIHDKYPDAQVETVSNFLQMHELMEKRVASKENFDFIISDLHVAGEGLQARGDKPNGAVLNGWVFIRDYLLDSTSPYIDIMKGTKIIVFSAFLVDLEEYISQTPKEVTAFSQVSQVEKGAIYSGQGGYDQLMQKIDELFRR